MKPKTHLTAITNPYRPAVWATPSDHTPFIVKSGEELPAGNGELSHTSCGGSGKKASG